MFIDILGVKLCKFNVLHNPPSSQHYDRSQGHYSFMCNIESRHFTGEYTSGFPPVGGGGGWIENWFFFPHGDTPPFGPPSQTFLAETPVPLEHQSVKDLLEKFHIDHFILFWKIFLCFNVLI